MISSGLCELCRLPLGRDPWKRALGGQERSFCCAGCLNVYAILLESGSVVPGTDLRETDLYRRSMALGLIAKPDREEAGQAAPPVPPDAETREMVYQVGGMWCSSCAWLIERAVCAGKGVRSAEVSFASDLMRVRYCPQYMLPGWVERRVVALGYSCAEYTGQRETEGRERRDLLLRIGVAAFIWMNVMYLSMIFYVGYFERVADSARRIVPFLLMALSAPAIFYSAFPILRIAWLGLRQRMIRVETLLALGILSAWFYSAAQAFLQGPHFYFDTTCALVTMVLTGKLIERSARDRTVRAVSRLYRMLPRKARVFQSGGERFVAVEALAPGTVFVVKPGETIPADGIVAAGDSLVNESILTGEPTPVQKCQGSLIACGSTNETGILHVRTSRTGGATTFSQIIRLVEQAIASRSDLERQADRISRVFVPVTIGIAFLTFAVAFVTNVPGAALMRAISVLVVACPCALGIATPLAVTAAVGAASRRGILVSDTRFLETADRIDVLILDKTGTLTEGEFRLVDFSLAQHEGNRSLSLFREEHLPILASIERYSEHPLGRALLAHAVQNGAEPGEAQEVTIRQGAGLTGLVGLRRVFVGSRDMPEVREAAAPEDLDSRAESWARSGYTTAWYGWDGAIQGVLAFGDRIKAGAVDAIRILKKQGVSVWIVSGDTQSATAFAAASVGADGFHASCLPDRKVEVITELQRQGKKVAMAGDGVNDAPALAQADLGIAMGSGTDIAMRAAPVTLMSADLLRIPETFSLARATVRVVRQNLFWAFVYNTAGIGLAVAGLLNPIAAAGAMVLSSLSVIANSLRLSKRTNT